MVSGKLDPKTLDEAKRNTITAAKKTISRGGRTLTDDQIVVIAQQVQGRPWVLAVDKDLGGPMDPASDTPDADVGKNADPADAD